MNALGYKKQEKCWNSSAITTITKYMNITQLIIHTMWIDDSSILVFALVIQNVNQMTDSSEHLIEMLQFMPRPIHRSCTIPECQPCESAIQDKAQYHQIAYLHLFPQNNYGEELLPLYRKNVVSPSGGC